MNVFFSNVVQTPMLEIKCKIKQLIPKSTTNLIDGFVNITSLEKKIPHIKKIILFFPFYTNNGVL